MSALSHYREQELRKLYPEARLETVGFAKLDPLFDGPGKEQLDFDLAEYGLDPARPTLLYAPTFYPSSIERMPRDLPVQLADCNLLLKPHQFTFTKRNYRHQLRKLERWAEAENTVLLKPDQLSLLPFMKVADLMISDASSALFEFAALDRPVVWCDFIKYRLGHRGIFRKRREKRMDIAMNAFADIAAHAARPGDIAGIVRAELARTPCRNAQALFGCLERLTEKSAQELPTICCHSDEDNNLLTVSRSLSKSTSTHMTSATSSARNTWPCSSISNSMARSK